MDSAGANNNFIEILESHFAFGIRINSPIEIMRFKRFYADDYGMDCSWTDEEIMDKIQQNCFIHEEIGITKKLLGKNGQRMFCLSCLAEQLEVTEEELVDKINEFKEEGCKLFE